MTVAREKRLDAWARLARDIDLDNMQAMTSHVGFDELPEVAEKITKGQIRGRVVVDIG